LPTGVGPGPNEDYHGAVFSIASSVEKAGAITRGQHHSVGEPCIKYDTAVMPLSYKDIMLGHRTVAETDRTQLSMVAGGAVALAYEMAHKILGGRLLEKEAVAKLRSYVTDKKTEVCTLRNPDCKTPLLPVLEVRLD
jgi:hypothetical protein